MRRSLATLRNARIGREGGFTLLEISIVLVIIGLIIGGILAGKELIKAAEVRKTVAMIHEYDTAVNVFKMKYNCIPGDCAAAATLFSGAISGDGNGKIEVPDDTHVETVNAWQQLSQANLIGGKYLGTSSQADYSLLYYDPSWNLLKLDGYMPKTPQNYYVGLGYGSTQNNDGSNKKEGHYFSLLYFPWETPPNFIWSSYSDSLFNSQGSLTPYQADMATWMLPADAYAIDAKIDDGLPLTGKARTYTAVGCATADNGSINQYDTSTPGTTWRSQQYGCPLLFQASGI
jgi:prepilin-type N-terminal cleavage/methylation domain-containing protein